LKVLAESSEVGGTLEVPTVPSSSDLPLLVSTVEVHLELPSDNLLTLVSEHNQAILDSEDNQDGDNHQLLELGVSHQPLEPGDSHLPEPKEVLGDNPPREPKVEPGDNLQLASESTSDLADLEHHKAGANHQLDSSRVTLEALLQAGVNLVNLDRAVTGNT